MERAYRAIRKRDLNTLESRTAVDLKINGQDSKKRSKRKDLSLFEEKFRGSPLRHVKREYWPMQSDYSGKSTVTNVSRGESLSQTLSLSSLSRHSKSSILNASIISNVERPRTRAQKVGQRLPYGVVDRPYTTAGISEMRSRKKIVNTVAANADAMAVTALVADLLNGANLTKSFLFWREPFFLLPLLLPSCWARRFASTRHALFH